MPCRSQPDKNAAARGTVQFETHQLSIVVLTSSNCFLKAYLTHNSANDTIIQYEILANESDRVVFSLSQLLG